MNESSPVRGVQATCPIASPVPQPQSAPQAAARPALPASVLLAIPEYARRAATNINAGASAPCLVLKAPAGQVPQIPLAKRASEAAPGIPPALNPEAIVSAVPSSISVSEMQDKTGAKRLLKYTAVVTRDGAELPEKTLFKGEPADLIIAVDVTGNTKGHMYLVIDGVRIDGRMFFNPHSEAKGDWNISNGLVIRYQTLPPETKRRLVEWVESSEDISTPTCVAAASKILYGEDRGNLGPAPGKEHWFPSKLLKHLALNGLVAPEGDTNAGQRLEPEIYTINSEANVFWNDLPDLKAVPSFIFGVALDPYTWEPLVAKVKGWFKRDSESP